MSRGWEASLLPEIGNLRQRKIYTQTFYFFINLLPQAKALCFVKSSQITDYSSREVYKQPASVTCQALYLWDLHVYKIKFVCFSPVKLYVNLIVRLVKRTLRVEENFSASTRLFTISSLTSFTILVYGKQGDTCTPCIRQRLHNLLCLVLKTIFYQVVRLRSLLCLLSIK